MIANVVMQVVITYVSLEGEMAAVERVVEFAGLPAEGEFEKKDVQLKPEWPRTEEGIEVKNLSFRYRPELDTVLKSISFKLLPREHVGIVGRTGAGKSSITVAMYRLAEPEKDSEIIVDGVNITCLGLH